MSSHGGGGLPFSGFVHAFEAQAKGKYGIHFEPRTLAVLGFVAFFLLLTFAPDPFLKALSLALFTSPLWLPFLIVGGAWTMWLALVRSKYTAAQTYILLEIIPPRNFDKTPLAMEAVLSGLHLGPNESNWYKRYILGATRPWYSLEIASLEGQVHFFIWTRIAYRRTIETQIYAQYPGAQVVEAPDYTKIITATPGEWEVWGCDYNHSRPDAFPIKTYVEYGLDKVQKEPEQVDPLANLIEFMGSFKKGEYFWLQIIIRVHGSTQIGEKYSGKLNKEGKQYTWRDEGREEVEKIREMANRESVYTDPFTGKQVISKGFPNPTKGQQELIAAIERNIAKLAFDTGIRAVYIAKPGKFDAAVVAGMKGLFKQMSSEIHNDINWNTSRGIVKFEDYPWEWNLEKRKDKERHHIVEAFRRRQFFHAPFAYHDYMVMSTEELATIFHIPSGAVQTPSMLRINSPTEEAPSNLPT